MATKGSIQTNLNRKELVNKYANRRKKLKDVIMNKNTAPEERFAAQIKLAGLPRNSALVRIRNRCSITGRPRGYYRRFGVSRIALREMASFGLLPGVKKSSW
jgi:small subunit ribosomal protein S14